MYNYGNYTSSMARPDLEHRARIMMGGRDMLKQRSMTEAWSAAMSAPVEGEFTPRLHLVRQFDATRAALGVDPLFDQQRLPFAVRLNQITPDQITNIATMLGATISVGKVTGGKERKITIPVPDQDKGKTITFLSSKDALGERIHSVLVSGVKGPGEDLIDFSNKHTAVIMGVHSVSIVERNQAAVDPTYVMVTVSQKENLLTVNQEDAIIGDKRYGMQAAKAIEVLNPASGF